MIKEDPPELGLKEFDDYSLFVVSDIEYHQICKDMAAIRSHKTGHVLELLYRANETSDNCVAIYKCAACDENELSEPAYFMKKGSDSYKSSQGAFKSYYRMAESSDRCENRESFLKRNEHYFEEDDIIYWADEENSCMLESQSVYNLRMSNKEKAKLFDLAQKNVVVSVVSSEETKVVSDNSDKNIKGVIMSTEVVKKSKKSTTQMIKESALHGVKVAAVDEVGETFLDVGKELLGELVPKEVFDTDSGRALTKAVTAVLLYHFNGTMLENIEGLDTACSLQIEASSRDLGQPLMKKLKPKLDKLARLGKSAISQ